MDVLLLIVVFLSALVISGALVELFGPPIDAALNQAMHGDMAGAWSKYIKFAVFVVAFTGGLRLGEIQPYVNSVRRGAAAVPLDGGQVLMELFRTLIGALSAASSVLLLFFSAVLAVYAGREIYARIKVSSTKAPEHDRRPAHARESNSEPVHRS